MNPDLPARHGLYDPRFEHDACGVSFVANISGARSREIVTLGITALCNMEHRGATGAEAETGDGAGILIQVPDRFLRETVDFDLPAAGSYAVGMAFLPADPTGCVSAMSTVERITAEEGLRSLGWRGVEVNPDCLGASARAVMPSFRLFFLDDPDGAAGFDLDRKILVVRKRIERELSGPMRTYFPSLSARTLVWKGMLTTPELGEFYPELWDERIESALALVHSRFSTNTFPSWPLAHPYRYIAHNGEINTIQGNRNWMRTRESMLESKAIPGLERAFPICAPGMSDSASFDEVLELLHLSGRSLPHALLMMIPEAWENNERMDPRKRAFYEYHASLMEPWDGPANVAFTDGTVIGAVLDRNGLRPGRWWVTSDGLVVLASESGVLEIDPARVVRKGRLQPGRMFLIDTEQGRIIDDEEIKLSLAAEHPYAEWLAQGLTRLADLPAREHIVHSHDSVLRRQQMFGWTEEELKVIIAPTARTGAEPIGSMGTDTPIAVLSERPRLLFDYFQQLFAQVTNPPLDAIREEVVTSVGTSVGPEANLLAPGPDSCRQLVLPFPIIDNDDLARIIHIDDDGTHPHLASVVVGGLFRVADGGRGLREALDRVRAEVSEAIDGGARIIVLSDRNSDEVWAPVPSLLLTAAVHHHLIREKRRTKVGLVVECGDAREVHHMALLIGFGAGAINPYLAFESIEDMISADEGRGLHQMGGIDPVKAVKNYIKASGKGVLKVMSKMGVSTVASYTGAQIFEAIGLADEVVEEFFTGTVSRLGGIGLDEIAREVAMRHATAHPKRPDLRAHRKLELGGEYQWRREGELHLFNPETVYRLQHATRAGRYDLFKQYTAAVDDQSRKLATLRGLFELRAGARPPVPIGEVEPVAEIVKRFSTGAMSYGSISAEAHETLAIAMNRIGGKSNTGEGGEDPARYRGELRGERIAGGTMLSRLLGADVIASDQALREGDSLRSKIKQVASARFGVTAEYLVSADQIQIKMAQGAKPGEGGQLPGHKVSKYIGFLRYSVPGVGLISPPPHHDIYSIEDLAQLIHDLKNVNPRADISVKLVSEVGVGTIAAGVAKAKADHVVIAGHDGGTGASPWSSIKHAGTPWELGLAETQQTLVLNRLRGRIRVQADGQMKTGRDVVIGALLGADEFGFATAPLVASGCIM
ncbi:MAG: glutamate synthase-related protein, partial [Actinomycetota bacterium]